MRLRIRLRPVGVLDLPIQYNHILQGMIYSQLDASLARELHDKTIEHVPNKRFKMFTFSRLKGVYRMEGGRICFEGDVQLDLSSSDVTILSSFAEHVLQTERLRLGRVDCGVLGVEILPRPRVDASQAIRVFMISPVTIARPGDVEKGEYRNEFLSPFDDMWSEALVGNLLEKARGLGWEQSDDSLHEICHISPLQVEAKDRKRLTYKGRVIEAWMGDYELRLPEGYFWLAYDVGLGAKNSLGLGMFDVARRP